MAINASQLRQNSYRVLDEVSATAQVVIDALRREIGLKICRLPFPEACRHALSQAWSRDPFDRLITGHAAIKEAEPLTKDRVIRANNPRAIW